jgi:hypothetical protein
VKGINVIDKIIKIILAYREYYQSKVINKQYYKVMPINPLHDDLYVVAFPKSGVTWLNFLMANVHLKMSGSNQNITFYNIDDFLPDIEQVRCLKENILLFPGHRVIKSHAEFNPLYQKIIYLVRDPRDVMVSYYWFLKNAGSFQEDLSQLIRSQTYGIAAWCRHVQGWVERTPLSSRIEFIRYEDMKADIFKVLSRIYTLLGHQIPTPVLEQAIELASFDNMKKLEADYNFGGDFRFPGLEFVRKGKPGSYVDEMSEDDLALISAKASRWLTLFGYSQQ